eukprot:scaffold224914_cov27-Tisochrysis_lutea.AAC.1
MNIGRGGGTDVRALRLTIYVQVPAGCGAMKARGEAYAVAVGQPLHLLKHPVASEIIAPGDLFVDVNVGRGRRARVHCPRAITVHVQVLTSGNAPGA